MTKILDSIEYAQNLDLNCPLAKFRDEFYIPQLDGKNYIYFAGNSLGLEPRNTKTYIAEVLEDWKNLAVEAHFKAKNSWMPYHHLVTDSLANLTGANADEVVAMGSLTNNLHLMLVSFYRPNKSKYKILIEPNAFPSDRYAVESQARYHGFNPKEAVIEFSSKDNNLIIKTQEIIDCIEKNKDELALILIGQPNYLTGQAFDIRQISNLANKYKIPLGLNLAHGIANLDLNLHELNIDFAVWCSYKYLNAGAGGIAGLFFHQKHHSNENLLKFTGWWGHNEETRFKMPKDFEPILGAQSYQLSNPPILQLAALRASLELFDKAQIKNLRTKSIKLTNYLEQLILNDEILTQYFSIITPSDENSRGSQLSLKLSPNLNRQYLKQLNENGLIADFREPDIIRLAPTAMYNTFEEVFNCIKILKNCIGK